MCHGCVNRVGALGTADTAVTAAPVPYNGAAEKVSRVVPVDPQRPATPLVQVESVAETHITIAIDVQEAEPGPARKELVGPFVEIGQHRAQVRKPSVLIAQGPFHIQGAQFLKPRQHLARMHRLDRCHLAVPPADSRITVSGHDCPMFGR